MLDYEFTTDAQRSSDPRKNIFLRRQLCGQQTSISTDFCSSCICHLVSLLASSPFSPVPHVSAILVFLCLSEDLVRNTFHPRHPFIYKIHLFLPDIFQLHMDCVFWIFIWYCWASTKTTPLVILTYCLTPAPRDSMVTPPSPNSTPLAWALGHPYIFIVADTPVSSKFLQRTLYSLYCTSASSSSNNIIT